MQQRNKGGQNEIDFRKQVSVCWQQSQLECHDCDWHALHSKPISAILLCSW